MHIYGIWAFLVAQLVKNHLQCRRPGFDPWVGKISWRRKRLPTTVFWAGEFHRLDSPWGCKELDTTEQLSLHYGIQKIGIEELIYRRGWDELNRNNCNSSFPICMSFIYFSCLIALARTFSTLVNSSGKIGILALFMILEEKFSVSPQVWFLLYGCYYVEVISFYSWFVECFQS